MAEISVSELETATLLALTRKPSPDAEDFGTACDRIADNIAASHQEECLLAHHSSIASDAKIARTLQEEENNTPLLPSEKPKTCRVLGLGIKCQACKERRAANSCVRRREWFTAQQTSALPKRPRRAVIAATKAIVEQLDSEDVYDEEVCEYQESMYMRVRRKEPGLQVTLPSVSRKRKQSELNESAAAAVSPVATPSVSGKRKEPELGKTVTASVSSRSVRVSV
jgi:hypothetical protein